MNHLPTDTYTAEQGKDGSWLVIHRKWRRVKRYAPRPAPSERIIHTFTGPDAKELAFQCVSKLTGKRGKSYEKRRMH